MEFSEAATPVKIRRGWLRFSLRTLLLVVTLLGIWVGFKAQAVREQRDAVEAILKAGGEVGFDYQVVPSKSSKPYEFTIDPKAAPPGPAWLRSLLGEELFRTPVAVQIEFLGERRLLKQSVIAQIVKLKSLRRLGIAYVDNADLEQLGQLLRLESLAFDSRDWAAFDEPEQRNRVIIVDFVSDAGLKYLRNLRQLRHLGIMLDLRGDATREQIPLQKAVFSP